MSIIGRLMARNYLKRANLDHLRDFPQVACFSFDLITAQIHLDGQYERDQLEFLSWKVFPFLAPGSCLDVGANIGNHSLHFAKYFDQVVAFEPHPKTFKLLAINADLSQKILALNLGASNKKTTVRVIDNPHNMGATAIHKSGAGNAVDFSLVCIDDLEEVKALKSIVFMKFDIEGHEKFAIEGAKNTISRHRPLIVLEVLKEEIAGGNSPAPSLLQSFGYEYFYEPVPNGVVSSLPLSLRKLVRTLTTILTGKRPSKAVHLKHVTKLEKRNYTMLLCSFTPLAQE